MYRTIQLVHGAGDIRSLQRSQRDLLGPFSKWCTNRLELGKIKCKTGVKVEAKWHGLFAKPGMLIQMLYSPCLLYYRHSAFQNFCSFSYLCLGCGSFHCASHHLLKPDILPQHPGHLSLAPFVPNLSSSPLVLNKFLERRIQG